MQATSCQRKLLMGRKKLRRHAGDADLHGEQQRGAVAEGQMPQGIRLTPTLCQVEQGQARIQEGAHGDEDRASSYTPRPTIHIGMVAFARPTKACTSALPAERTPERRGARTSVSPVAPFACLFVSCRCHGDCVLPDVIPVRHQP
jgi:hypothetical protein